MRNNEIQKTNAVKKALKLKIEHAFPVGQVTAYSNHFTVQHTDDGEFLLAFYEVVQPMFLGEPQEVREQIAKLETITAACISRVMVSESEMPKIIGALAANYEKYVASKEDAAKQDTKAKAKGKKHAI